jgi:dihydrodipicolinate synthase/N-acetylneuraminate lyase
MMKKIKGVIPPMITPFDEYGGLDERNPFLYLS